MAKNFLDLTCRYRKHILHQIALNQPTNQLGIHSWTGQTETTGPQDKQKILKADRGEKKNLQMNKRIITASWTATMEAEAVEWNPQGAQGDHTLTDMVR